ncbi:hypothetical protein GQ53DRAFT_211195 [Thozetella sp. PMI_491]|nr:hypothetical protein GQ53DRAFT_211195 [Thozetella sp. PMI_491]
MRADLFLRLPAPTAVLVLTSLLELVPAAHALYNPRARYTALPVPTVTVAHHVLDVVAWPPLPTTPPLDLFDLRRRQDDNTICGYVGGDADIPATCGAGSHCVLDPEHGAIGCCPNGQEPCTTGIFTGCVDSNSPPQTELNPYVFTCQGAGNVCYQNQFDGGFYQFGCGTASDLATTVIATVSGKTLTRETETFSFTATPTTLSEPTTIGTKTSTSTTSSSTSSSSTTTSTTSSTSSSTSSTTSSTSSTTSKTSTTQSSATPSGTLPPDAPGSSTTAAPSSGSGLNVAAIVGGTISGVAVIVAAIALGFWLYNRQHRGNTREGPGGPPGGGTQYISPTWEARSGFAPVHQTYDGYETGLPPEAHMGYTAEISGGNGNGDSHSPLEGADRTSYPPATGYHYPGQFAAAYAGAGAGAAAVIGGAAAAGAAGAAHQHADAEPDQVPLTREMEDFTRGFHTALGRIGEEDEFNDHPSSSSGERVAVNEGNGVMNGRLNGPSNASEMTNGARPSHEVSDDEGETPANYGNRPLWQQNRRTSRGVAWM